MSLVVQERHSDDGPVQIILLADGLANLYHVLVRVPCEYSDPAYKSGEFYIRFVLRSGNRCSTCRDASETMNYSI